MTPTKDKYLTLQVVGDILSCKERHIYNLIVEGELIAIKVGGRAVRVSEQSLLAFVERRKINPEDLFDPDREKQTITKEPAQQQIARSRFIGK